MAELTKKEIQDQLNKLGIYSNSELNLYSREYEKYSINQNPLSYAPRTYRETSEIDQQFHPIARKFARTCRALFPAIGNFFTLSRVKAYKK
jgi:hypothetical protein